MLNWARLCEVFSADDLAQALFDAKFHLLDGPDAPVVAIAEFDQELVIDLGTIWIQLPSTTTKSATAKWIRRLRLRQSLTPNFSFKGIWCFQLKDGGVSNSDLFDTDKARLLAQCDIRDGVGTIVNRVETFIEGLDDPVLTDLVMVTGAKMQGIFHMRASTRRPFCRGQ
jgi:hypothetical protein